MTDDTSSTTTNAATGPWLSPSEALTRFVPQRRTRHPEMRETAPARFGFRVGDIGLLVPTGMRSELVEETEIYPLPTTPAWFPGLINLRGGLVPVFDLRTLFDLDAPDGSRPNLLVLNAGTEAVSVLIDGLPLAVDTDRRMEQPPPLPKFLREHSRTVYLQEQEIWVDFDYDEFFQAAGGRIARRID